MIQESVNRYPLEWPLGWKRTRSRRYGRFVHGKQWITVDKAFKAAAKERHPDVGGTEIEMSHLNRARDYAFMELET